MKGFLSGFFRPIFKGVSPTHPGPTFSSIPKMTQASYQNRYRTRETRETNGHLPWNQFSGPMLALGIVFRFSREETPKSLLKMLKFQWKPDIGFEERQKFGSTHSRSKIRESLQIKEKYLRIRRARGFLRPACSVPAWSKSLNTLNCSLKEVDKKSPAKKTC